MIVNVHSCSEALGKVRLKTHLNLLDRVDLTMWALNYGTVMQFRQRCAELRQYIAVAGPLGMAWSCT